MAAWAGWSRTGFATDGHPSRRQLGMIVAGYATLLAFALPTILHFETSIAFTPPHFSLGPIPGAVLFWGWVAARLAAIALGAGWLLRAMRARALGPLRRRQLRAALATILLAGFGASLRFLPVIGDADRWIGTSFITLAVMATTGVLAYASIWRSMPSISKPLWGRTWMSRKTRSGCGSS